jgi:NADPH:quinone reductase-like Zn-dependent oxidoreductase
MKAVVVSEFGGPEQLRLAEAADPVPGPGQVRIAVRAAGTNPVDAGNRADGSWAGLQAPCILGYDVAGVVESLGPAVRGASSATPYVPYSVCAIPMPFPAIASWRVSGGLAGAWPGRCLRRSPCGR